VSATGLSVDAARDLRAICGDDNARERPVGGVYVTPGSAEEVAAVLALANQHQLSVVPAGGSTECNAAESRGDIVLHLNRLTQVEHYDHADLTVGVGAGVTVAQLNALVGADRLLFACDPPLPERATVGGILATSGHGPLRQGYGALRDFCIGIRFVAGDGRRAKGGGRVVKNVAGYDLMKLMIGSYGTLAVITSASFKLFPAPRQTRTFLAEFKTAKEALAFRDRVMRSPLSPMCLELVSPRARKLMRPEMTEDAWVMCLRASGSDAVLARYRKELGEAITRELEGDAEQKMWRAISNFLPAAGPADPHGWLHNASMKPALEINAPPSEMLRIVNVLDDIDAHGAIGVAFIGRVAVGHLLAVTEVMNLEVPWPPAGIVEALQQEIGKDFSVKVCGGTNPWVTAPASPASMRAVKHALDPNHVLRGRDIS